MRAPCNCARKTIELQMKGNPTFRAGIKQLQNNDHELWKAKVRSCRTRPADELLT